ncbi:hypothetical protein SAMN02927921_01087 [Sinomicrobium oceani]|uniref:CD-NTase-associated protein 15 domain-containing protein n=1 Tax=Sinomicrobium oceani TaxID=1150368 RepID=A0A1K1N7Y6_9FLAO|nr:hypothetical protein [Sinomicrobium oceani]SFW31428.1 hypothetical protein SAMN02927921_01087 [Sinomicrobium oceani]
MEGNYFKYYKPSLIVPFILIVGTAISYLVALSIPKIFQVTGITYYQFPSSSVLLIGLLHWIDKSLWRYKPFKWLFRIDDFSGRYEGKLVYTYRDDTGQIQTGELDHIKTICQTGSKITMNSFTKDVDGNKSSVSVNKIMCVEKTRDDKHFRLIYSYRNKGSIEKGFPAHYGTEMIKFIKKGKHKMLTGEYFTNRIPYQTKGELKELYWKSKDISHDF